MSTRFLYENSVVYQGYLIIPRVDRIVLEHAIYSYHLLSTMGHHAQWHRAENPAQKYAGSLEQIIAIAQTHLDSVSDIESHIDYFQERYVYQNNLIMISAIASKYFYDHYPPDRLQNIAAPKLFPSEQACINWVKQGIDRH
jgi:hypothetical protein